MKTCPGCGLTGEIERDFGRRRLRELAAKIADHQAYVDADAVTVAEAYLELWNAAAAVMTHPYFHWQNPQTLRLDALITGRVAAEEPAA